MATKLFVGNLSFQATNADLEDLFSQVGAVSSATIIMDKMTGKSRGFGFVEMSTNQEAQQAVARFNGTELHGRALTVNEAKPQEPRGGGGGGRSFGGGNRGGGGRERRW
ncbi:MAG: RNA-binding protein [Deltaproteobacteria bacterium]|nr:RNA-binding protein [Deltaproteobacteria bacterium]